MENKILLIENQFQQFEKIHNMLNSFSYETVPSLENFHYFMERVHVILHPGYDREYKEKAEKLLFEDIENFCPRMIIMDHMLGGAHNCCTGIRLATQINEERRRKNRPVLPVLFLSRTPHEDEKRMLEYKVYEEKYPMSKWMPKGFLGTDILDDTYFEQYILKEGIEPFVNDREKQLFLFFEEQAEKLANEDDATTDNKRNGADYIYAIMQAIDSPDFTKQAQDALFDELLQIQLAMKEQDDIRYFIGKFGALVSRYDIQV